MRQVALYSRLKWNFSSFASDLEMDQLMNLMELKLTFRNRWCFAVDSIEAEYFGYFVVLVDLV